MDSNTLNTAPGRPRFIWQGVQMVRRGDQSLELGRLEKELDKRKRPKRPRGMLQRAVAEQASALPGTTHQQYPAEFDGDLLANLTRSPLGCRIPRCTRLLLMVPVDRGQMASSSSI